MPLERSIFLQVTIALCLAACGPKPITSKRLSAVTVGQSENTPFYTRWSLNDRRIIITDAERTRTGHEFLLGSDVDLYGVEFLKSDHPVLINEVFRDDRVVFFTAQDERQAGMIAAMVEHFSHPRKIDLTKINTTHNTYTVASGISRESNLNSSMISIDPITMREDLESISGARPINIGGQTVTLSNRATNDFKSKARAWLRQQYESLGYQVTEQRYSSGTNLIAEKRSESPMDDQIFVVSAHLDTVQTAGADDDGSGTITSLTVARSLSAIPLKRTLRFVAFDEEERGLVGSSAYAAELVKNNEINKITLFNLEMTGHDSDGDGDFHAIDCQENSSPDLTRALLTAIANEGIALKHVDACTNRSDHAIFWEHSRPAIVVSQNFFGGDGNPCYHRSCDTTQKINWDYMTKITRAAAHTIANLNAY